MSAQEQLTTAWNESYDRQENYLFFPSDEMIKFFARKIRRRVGVDKFKDIAQNTAGAKFLDIGCGIGRHVKFAQEVGLEAYGCDLSQSAIEMARAWLKDDIKNADKKLLTSDITQLPWEDAFFDHAASDSVLDSMPFETAQIGIGEIARVVKSGGYFYCSLISGDETGRTPEFCDEVLVQDQHEQNTIQSYFSYVKIKRLLEPLFEILDCYLIQHKDQKTVNHHGRWHVVAKRR